MEEKKFNWKKFWTMTGLIVVCLGLTCLSIVSIGKWYVDKKIGLIHQETSIDFSSYNFSQNETVTEETEADVDNIDDVEKELIVTDAKSFFENIDMVNDNYVKNILFVGTDVRVSDSWNGNSDSMILISINNKTKKIIMTSFMRDMYVYVPHMDKCGKLNMAHANGGGQLLCETISGMFKVKVDDYVRVDFYGMMAIVNSVGGIDMEIIDAEIPVANKYIKEMCKYTGENPDNYYLTTSGMQHLNGMQAVAYARIRYVGNADFERTNRQRKILTEIINKCKNMSLGQINSFADTVLPNLATNMTNEEIWELIGDALKYFKYGLVTARVPFDGTYTGEYIDSQSVILPDYSKNVSMLLDVIYGND